MAHLNQSLFATLISLLCFIVIGRGTAFAWIGGRIRLGRNVVAPSMPIWPITSKQRFSLILVAMKQRDAHDQEYSNEQNEINSRIHSVASTICNLSAEQVNIEWKPNRIVVTVNVDQAYIDATDGADDIGLLEDDNFDADDKAFDTEEIDDPTAIVDDLDSDAVEDTFDIEADNSVIVDEEIVLTNGVDLTLLARSINAALDDAGRIGSQIAELYEIEVTTPGVTDELTTPVMFSAYRGFDVLVQHQDPKTKKIKTFEGRLVERNADFVVLNIKGRMKHLKNAEVLSVKLPKAKKEKGVR
jgi:ribosome maturation factor RimP